MSAQGFYSEHWTDEEGRPAGGVSTGRGFTISWQNGPLGRGDDRREPNGAFVEDLTQAIIDRIEFYNEAGFDCPENRSAITCLEGALNAMRKRTASREEAGVEGTHERRDGDA